MSGSLNQRRLIEVTEEDIRLGNRCDAQCCAIARALGRVFGPEVDVEVDYDQATLSRDDESRVWFYRLPPRAVRFVKKFDCGQPVGPFRFWLVPAGYYLPGGILVSV